ncbi:restriction endonuclease subunit S [Tenacibaculum finnmarkense]|uniref:restriction endonuclease subunit S n=1 Tax=Tenacibaculum finnmarkense TaxID=2781243 RepID=UPI001EFC09DF|nr:restriction endonuclease subunit S [Tenacibaculum finnmarkense]MCG8795081.1 restriction endonuclease subunit S [Tenacibaculum finnmarkense]MCG8797408.1 restriction endonuclease subunit S [Tenacibaculum finnmarkense]
MSLSIKNIPSDWELKNLGGVSTIIMGQSPSSNSYNEIGIGSYLIQGNADIKNRKSLPRQWTSEPTKICKIGDILMTVRAPVGAIAKSNHNACIGRGVCSIKSKNTDNEFLYQFLLSYESKWKSLEQGSTFTAVNGVDIRGINIPIPPLKEQQKIAEILSTVDAKISIIDAQISETQNLKKGLMQSLLSKGIGHTEFKKSALGEIPKSWEVVKLDKIAKISRGKFQHRPRNAPEFYGGKYPYVQTGDIGKSNGKIIKYSQTLNELGLSVSKLFPKGTIVITIAANIGDTAIAQFEIAFPDSLIGINVKEEVNNIFLRYFLVTQKNNLNKLSTVSAQKNINLETLKPYKIPLPPIKEQEKIASILNSVDEKLGVLSEKKSYYQNLKKGLMQQLLTGKVRVSV